MANALNWFEIPVNNMGRARQFYETMLAIELFEMSGMGDMQMYTFPRGEGGVSGALMAGEGYMPSQEGVMIYLNAGEYLSNPVNRVESAGGTVVAEKIDIGENGFIAFIIDTEGNKIGLHAMKE